MMLRNHQPVLFCLLLLGALMSARGELVLANFSAAHPIKIMAIGDSITDDCVLRQRRLASLSATAARNQRLSLHVCRPEPVNAIREFHQGPGMKDIAEP
jgi:hypothetical protein